MPLVDAAALDAPNVLLLDSAVWIAAATNVPGITSSETLLILETAAHASRLCVSAATVWELALLVQCGAIDFGDFAAWLDDQTRPPGVAVVPITGELSYACTQLPSWSDVALPPALPDIPAAAAIDRFLLATARQLDAVVVTTDPAILVYAERGSIRAYDARA